MGKIDLCRQAFNVIVLTEFNYVPFLILFKQEFVCQCSCF